MDDDFKSTGRAHELAIGDHVRWVDSNGTLHTGRIGECPGGTPSGHILNGSLYFISDDGYWRWLSPMTEVEKL